MLRAVITGDIINSRKALNDNWLSELKEALARFGKFPVNWEIFRGDSFQLECPAEDALEIAIYIKAKMKMSKHIDVRMSIGIGEIESHPGKITEANGSALINSGEAFDNLKKHNLAIKSDNLDFNQEMNLILELASITMDSWTAVQSEIIVKAIEFPHYNQEELAFVLFKSQSTISEALGRANFDEIKKVMAKYRKELNSMHS